MTTIWVSIPVRLVKLADATVLSSAWISPSLVFLSVSTKQPQVWDLGKCSAGVEGGLRLTLTGHISAVRALAVSDRFPYLFSCAEDKMVRLPKIQKKSQTCLSSGISFLKATQREAGLLAGVSSQTSGSRGLVFKPPGLSTQEKGSKGSLPGCPSTTLTSHNPNCAVPSCPTEHPPCPFVRAGEVLGPGAEQGGAAVPRAPVGCVLPGAAPHPRRAGHRRARLGRQGTWPMPLNDKFGVSGCVMVRRGWSLVVRYGPRASGMGRHDVQPVYLFSV